jgi:hypothetical protein
MFRLALAVMSLTVLVVGVRAQDSKSKQGAPKESKEMTAWVAKLDSDKRVLTILKQDGKQSELTFDDQTKFTTPQGVAMTTERLKKALLLPGIHVQLVMGEGTTLKEVHMLVGGRRDMPRAAKKAPAKDVSADPKHKEDKKDPANEK